MAITRTRICWWRLTTSDVYESVFVNTQINKSPEIGDVGYNTGQDHTYLQVIDGMHRVIEMEFLYLRARVARRLFQFV